MSVKPLTFSSEELLRQAIANLLTRMPDVRNVQIFHGQQEHGKDIVFWAKGPLGETFPCACVAKNSDITGSVDKNQGARAVCIQAEQALDTPFVDSFGTEQRIHRVYIVSPSRISASAMNSIKGKLTQRAGQIVFYSGSSLFELFRTYWLDFFADEYISLENHLLNLATDDKHAELHAAVDLYGLGKSRAEGKTVYVNRDLQSHLPLVEFDSELLLPVPAIKRLDSLWRKADIEQTMAALNTLTTFLPHLETWSYLAAPGRELQEALGSFARSLQRAWLAGAQKAEEDAQEKEARAQRELSGAGATAHESRTKEPSPPLTPRTAKPGPYPLAGVEELYLTSRGLYTRLTAALAPLRTTCRLSASLPKSRKSGLELLISVAAKRVSSLRDCLQSAPTRLIPLAPGTTITANEQALRESQHSLIVVGAAGFGKTSFCRWNALLDAQAYREGTGILPIYVPLHALATEKLESPDDAFFRRMGLSALLSSEETDHKPAMIRLYLDGLDEVPRVSQRRRIVDLAKEISGPKVQIILTARDYIVAPWLSWLPRISLSGLDTAAQMKLAEGWIGEAPRLLRAFTNELRKAPVLADLMSVPLLATLIILVYRQTRTLPDTRVKLYSTFVDLLSGGWDVAKGILRASRFGQHLKVMVLSQVAATAHREKRRFFDGRLVRRAIRTVVNNIDEEATLDLIGELLVDGVIARSADEFFFSHLSFQEFLCARYMLGLPQRSEIERALRGFLGGEDWWREVIKFYVALSESPSALAEWLVNRLDVTGEDSMRAQEVWQAIEISFPSFSLSNWITAQISARSRDFERSPSQVARAQPSELHELLVLWRLQGAQGRQ